MLMPFPLVSTLTLVLVVLAGPLGAAQEPEVPKKREAQKLVEEWAQLDPRKPEQASREQQILGRLELYSLRKRELKLWQKTIEKAQKKRVRRLEPKSGAQWFWEKPQRGFFLVGGETRRPKGLVIGMHGGGVGSGDPKGIHPSVSQAAKDLDLVSICPMVLEKTERGWTDSGTEEFVMDLVDAAIRTWRLDPAKVYFVGHSMGGYGSWTLGAHHADRVAGLGPCAGAPTPVMNYQEEIIDLDFGVIPNLRNVPMVVYQSVDDPKVPPDVNQKAAEFIAEAKEKWGGYDNFRYWEMDGRGHSYPPGGMKAVLEPLQKFERVALPERVVWQPKLAWKRQFYWLYWQNPKAEAILVADLDREANAIRLSCDKEIAGLRILLGEDMVDLEQEVAIYLNGKEVLRAFPQADLATMLRTSRAPDPDLQFSYSLALP
ncbi:MAG: hypothetical protein DWQ01_16890 [Planctomycetota bacterium]|nr:MAG: hypothetical protein DWQ01_16890 [Planctomycetota bacterium]